MIVKHWTLLTFSQQMIIFWRQTFRHLLISFQEYPPLSESLMPLNPDFSFLLFLLYVKTFHILLLQEDFVKESFRVVISCVHHQSSLSVSSCHLSFVETILNRSRKYKEKVAVYDQSLISINFFESLHQVPLHRPCPTAWGSSWKGNTENESEGFCSDIYGRPVKS